MSMPCQNSSLSPCLYKQWRVESISLLEAPKSTDQSDVRIQWEASDQWPTYNFRYDISVVIFFCLFCLLFVDFMTSSNDFKTNFAKMRLMLSLTVAHAQTLKETATLMITMFYMKDHNKPWIWYQFHLNRLKNAEVVSVWIFANGL